MEDQLSVQRDRVTGRVRTLGRALKGASSMLEEDDVVAQCLHFASDKVEGVAGYVDEMTTDGVTDDLRAMARDRPAWFFGGAFLLGLALGRFARSTAGSMAASSAKKPVSGRAPGRQRKATRTQAGATEHSSRGAPARPGATRS
jgi:hypothetical protein